MQLQHIPAHLASSSYRTSLPGNRRSVRLAGACHIALGTACLGAYQLTRQNNYLGAYPGYYGNWGA